MDSPIAYFVLAAVVTFVGLQGLGEHRDAFGVVPHPVMRPTAPHLIWGKGLVAVGGFVLAIGILGTGQPGLEQVLLGGQVISALILAAYGLWILVGSGKVAYEATPSEDHHH